MTDRVSVIPCRVCRAMILAPPHRSSGHRRPFACSRAAAIANAPRTHSSPPDHPTTRPPPADRPAPRLTHSSLDRVTRPYRHVLLLRSARVAYHKRTTIRSVALTPVTVSPISSLQSPRPGLPRACLIKCSRCSLLLAASSALPVSHWCNRAGDPHPLRTVTRNGRRTLRFVQVHHVRLCSRTNRPEP